MNWSYLLGACAVASFVLSGVAAANITRFLSQREIQVNPRDFTWLRRAVLRHLRDYKRLTRGETGSIGASYYGYVASIVGAVVLLAGAIAARLLR